MKSTRWMLAVLCALALVASACGDDEPDTTTADDAAATAQAEAAAAEAEAEAAEAERAAAQAEAEAAQAAAEEAQAAADEAAARLAEAEAAAAEASAEQQAEAQAALEEAQAEAEAAQAAAEAAQAEAEMAAGEAAEAQEALAAAEGAIAHDIGVDVESKTIRVGLNTDLTGIFAPLTTKITDAHLAYWEWVNDNGGIQGWTIEPVVLDNAYDVPTHLENYEVMSGDGPESVVMFATSTGSPHSASTSQLLIEDNMAAIPLSWYSGWADPSIGKNLFEVQTNYCIEAMNGTTYMAETYGPNVAIATFPGDYGQDAARGVKIAAEALGLNVVYDGEGAVIPGADQTPVISGIAESGADWVWVTLNPGHTAQLMGGSAAAGFTGQWIGSAPSWNPALLNIDGFKELADAFYTHSTYTVLLGEGAGAGAVGEAVGMQELLDVMREYRPEAPWDDFYIISWIQGYVVHQILDQAISNGNITRAGVLAAANQVTADLNGLAPDQSWVGNPNDNVVRETYLYDVDLSLFTPGATISDENGNSGYKLIKGPYASETALNWEYEPCFVAS
ncbi:MAG: ABC transporter substrate-binding protein [Acidimicrobiaceae bacterium]|nr:ABC transporter substrate-binding protein [Acidimicrobiaceae bacterium]